MSFLQPMMVAALVVGGMGVALLGSVKVPLARRLGIDEARVGGLVSVFGFTLIPVILTAGFLTDLIGRQVVLIGGSALLAAGLPRRDGLRHQPGQRVLRGRGFSDPAESGLPDSADFPPAGGESAGRLV